MWTESVVSNAPTGIEYAAQNYVQVDSKLYIIGDDGNVNNQMYIFDMTTNTNTLSTQLLQPYSWTDTIRYGMYDIRMQFGHI